VRARAILRIVLAGLAVIAVGCESRPTDGPPAPKTISIGAWGDKASAIACRELTAIDADRLAEDATEAARERRATSAVIARITAKIRQLPRPERRAADASMYLEILDGIGRGIAAQAEAYTRRRLADVVRLVFNSNRLENRLGRIEAAIHIDICASPSPEPVYYEDDPEPYRGR